MNRGFEALFPRFLIVIIYKFRLFTNLPKRQSKNNFKAKEQYALRHGGGCFLFFLSFAVDANGFYECQGLNFTWRVSSP